MTPKQKYKRQYQFCEPGLEVMVTEQPTLSLPKLLPTAKLNTMTIQSTRSELEKTINLQLIIGIEKCLASFYGRYGTARETTEIEKYFELLDDYTTMGLHYIYSDKYVRAAIRQATCLEIAAVVLHWFFVRE